MKQYQNVIELRPYLPVQTEPQQPARSRAEAALPWFAALIESVVTVGIGVCFLIGLVVSLALAL